VDLQTVGLTLAIRPYWMMPYEYWVPEIVPVGSSSDVPLGQRQLDPDNGFALYRVGTRRCCLSLRASAMVIAP
jgi:hypothetical protein